MKICTIVKDEYPFFVDEWITYHSKFGDLVIYDNNDLPTIKDPRATVYHFPGRCMEGPYMNDCVARYPDDVLLFIDMDEYWVPSQPVPFYESYCRDLGAIAFNWQVYGSSGIKQHKDRPQYRQFCHRLPWDHPRNHMVKTMVAGKYVKRWRGSHVARLIAGKSYNRRVSSRKTPDIDLSLGYIDHFFIRSLEAYQRKAERGSAWRGVKYDPRLFYKVDRACTERGDRLRYGRGYEQGQLGVP